MVIIRTVSNKLNIKYFIMKSSTTVVSTIGWYTFIRINLKIIAAKNECSRNFRIVGQCNLYIWYVILTSVDQTL